MGENLTELATGAGQASVRVPWALGRPLIVALRPQHWIKNLIVVAAPAFALQADFHTVASTCATFIAFCAASSAVYLVNDARDREEDARHELKRHRPIASGRLPVTVALAASAVLIGTAFVVSIATAASLSITIGCYLVIQAAYNIGLKQEPIVDLLCVSSGFVLRAVAGGVAAGIPLSTWFLLTVGFLAFYLAIEKRKAELTRSLAGALATRRVLRHYSQAWLLRMEAVVTASALMSYSLWAIQRSKTAWMLTTIPMVAYVLFRYQLLAESDDRTETPETLVVRSRHIMIGTAIWFLTAVGILLLQERRVL